METRIGDCIKYSDLTSEEKRKFIEPNIRALVNAINAFEGADTYASCDLLI